MHSLGIMTNDSSKEKPYFTGIAREAKKEEIQVFRFSPQNIDTDAGIIKGERYRPGRWEACEFRAPDYVYDRCFHGVVRQNSAVKEKIAWLKKHSPFLGYGLPGKWDIYQALKKDPFLQAFLPYTERLKDAKQADSLLAEYPKLLLKPEFGARGTGIFLLERNGVTISAALEKNGKTYTRTFSSPADSKRWLQRLLKKYSYLAQPFLELVNSLNEPFDIRILLQKDGQNQWAERGRGIRSGKQDGITANLATGGQAFSFESYVNTLPAARTRSLEPFLERISTKVPAVLEEAFGRLFELGVDLGFDKDGKIWILDVNSKPGRKTIERLYPEQTAVLYKAPAAYCKYLLESRIKAGE